MPLVSTCSQPPESFLGTLATAVRRPSFFGKTRSSFSECLLALFAVNLIFLSCRGRCLNCLALNWDFLLDLSDRSISPRFSNDGKKPSPAASIDFSPLKTGINGSLPNVMVRLDRDAV